ncbi:putative membrane C2G11.09 [Gossypium arboreum]|uniref:Putative membrane C2G11.09 n=1 Tax=Gossypium arboreum TaxID=29729 RepID=A0A0B0MS98_GOSAR|nr:putative membrane C2G11.09 [Gossypium arboreum]
MATLSDIGVSALINILTAFAFLLAFAVLRIQPVNDRVYLPKWYINGGRSSPRSGGNFVAKFVNLDFKTYLTFLNWMPQALKMSESELINHAGLDSAIFLRIYSLGYSFLFFSCVYLLVASGLEYLFTIWICYMLYKEYDNVATMRPRFLASQRRRAEQFTVVVRNVPQISGHSVSDSLDQFFKTNHPDTYLCHQAVYNANKFAKLVRKRDRLQNWLDYNQLKFERHSEKRPTKKTGFLGLWGKRVDSIDFYKQQIKEFDKNMALERQKVLKDTKSILPVAFVSFKSRWGAAVCAQTQQSKNPTLWLTNWAPEPQGLERVAPFLRPVIELKFIKSFLQGFLPGLALKILLYILPTILMIMSKIEGHIALSTLERRASAKIPRTIGVSIPMKATLFITYIMVDGWARIAGEILRLKPLVIFHLKNMFMVKSERDREQAMDPGSVDYPETLPSLQLYFLLGIVYAVVTPILLPFILNFFAFAYLVYRHQIINVYNQQYESGAAFWPHVHSRIIASLVISQLQLLGLLNTKEAANSTPLLAILPILTLSFKQYCKHRFEPAFRRYPLENLMLTTFLADAYLHPIFRSFEEEELEEVRVDKVRVGKNQSYGDNAQSQTSDDHSSPSPPHHPTTSAPQDVYHHGSHPNMPITFPPLPIMAIIMKQSRAIQGTNICMLRTKKS